MQQRFESITESSGFHSSISSNLCHIYSVAGSMQVTW